MRRVLLSAALVQDDAAVEERTESISSEIRRGNPSMPIEEFEAEVRWVSPGVTSDSPERTCR